MARAPPAPARARPARRPPSAARGTVELRDHAPGAGREDDDAVAQARGLLDVVGHEQDGARLPAQRLREPVLHLAPRQRVERGERLVEAQHAACPTAACAGRRRAGACRPRARGAGRARSPRGRRRRRAGARGRAPRRATPRPGAPPARRCRSRRSQGSRLSRWGMSTAASARRRARVRRLQSAHELEQRRLAAAAGADDGDDLARRRPRGRRPRARVPSRTRGSRPPGLPFRPHQRFEAPAQEPRAWSSSLPPRALPHRFEGSAPVRWALSQPASASPPVGL